MAKKINLNSDKLLNKKFSTGISGYSPEEVDKYLDLILSDYRIYEETSSRDESKLGSVESIILDKDREIEKLKIELTNLKHSLSDAQKNTNHDLMERLDSLERSMKK